MLSYISAAINIAPKFLLFVGFGFIAAFGAVQVKATPLNAWDLRCIKEDDSKQSVCSTEIHTRFNDKDFLFYFARGPVGPVPFIAHADNLHFSKMTVSVDDKAPLEADSCEIEICYYDRKKSRTLIKQFTRGQSAKIIILGPDGITHFDGTITLIGFSSAYKRYR